MKKLLLVLGAASLVACMHEKNESATVNEPAGAEMRSDMRTNSFDSSTAPRDANQQPYPGTSDLNQQRGSGSTSGSSLPNNSSGNSTGTGSSTSSGASQNP